MKTSRIVLGCILASFVFLAGGAGAQVVTEFSAGITPSAGLGGITAGPDGNLWFTEQSANQIGRITPQGVVTEFGAGISAGAGLASITAGPDGNLWFTEQAGNRIGRITPLGVVTEFSVGITAGAGPYDITTGPDGNLWFTERLGHRIGRITPAGVVSEFSVGTTTTPSDITAGPDGNLWFTECFTFKHFCNGRIGRITPLGVVTTVVSVSPFPVDITAGPDGNLWFTEYNRIGRITPLGVVTDFSTGITAGAGPYGIRAGPDGNLWFAENNINRIGRITPAGVVTEFSAGISPGATPTYIAAGPDGNLWFTEPGVNRIGRITIPQAAATTTTIGSSVNPSLVGQAVTFTASVAGNFPTGTVQFMNDGTNLGSPVTLSGGGIAQLITSTLTQGTHSIVAKYSGDASNAASQSAPLSQVVNGIGGGTSINVALAANGGVASASSTYSSLYPVSAVNDGDRAGLNFGNGGVWKDATLTSFPDWVQITFNGAKTIDHVIVYSVQDDNINPVEPTDTLTFTRRGITDFEVQAWNGIAWVSLGAVSGNNLVKRSLAFVATTTSKIRVVINSASNGRYSLLAEIEVWTP